MQPTAEDGRTVTVTVRTIGLLKSLFGCGELAVTLPGQSTVADLLSSLAATYGGSVAVHFADPGEAAVHPQLRTMVNGRDIAVLAGRQTVLADGDEILVLTPIAGG